MSPHERERGGGGGRGSDKRHHFVNLFKITLHFALEGGGIQG